jgi:hypothetical protein
MARQPQSPFKAVADSQDQRTDASRTHSCLQSKDLSQSKMPLSTSESLSTPSSFPQAGTGALGWGLSKYMEFNTVEQRTGSFRDSTYIAQAPYPIWHFEFNVPFLRGRLSDPTSAVSIVMGVIAAMKGRADTFLFDVPNDRTVHRAQFGTGDGTTTAFQITRPIGGAAQADIIQNFNGAPQIFINGTLQTSGYTIDSFGAITFSTAPAANAVLVWSGNFYF